jgi:hypothetical protein
LALATAEEKSGRLVSAKRTFAKTQADAEAAADKNLAQRATAAQAAVESRLPHVVIRLPLGGVNAQITLDDTPQHATTDAIEIDPGEHRIVVNAIGMQPFEERFRVDEREQKELAVVLSPVEAAPPAEVAHPDPASSLGDVAEPGQPASAAEPSPTPGRDRPLDARPGPPWPALALGGVGVAATVVGVIVTAKGKADYDDVKRGCPSQHCPAPEAAARGNAARDRILAGTITAGTGILSLAGAGLWWVLSASSSRGAASATPAMPPASADGRAFSLSVDASPATDGGWVRLSGAF